MVELYDLKQNRCSIIQRKKAGGGSGGNGGAGKHGKASMITLNALSEKYKQDN